MFLVAVLFMTDRATLNQFILTSASLIGAGLAIKTSALTLALIPIVATTGKLREIGALRILYAALLSLTICLVMFVILSPHSIKYIGSFLDTMRFERGVVTGDEDVYWTWQFIDQPRYLFPLSQFAWLCNPLTARSAWVELS